MQLTRRIWRSNSKVLCIARFAQALSLWPWRTIELVALSYPCALGKLLREDRAPPAKANLNRDSRRLPWMLPRLAPMNEALVEEYRVANSRPQYHRRASTAHERAVPFVWSLDVSTIVLTARKRAAAVDMRAGHNRKCFVVVLMTF